MIYPDCDMKRWECCDNSVILANADYYYTKEQVDEKLDDIVISGGGVTEDVVENMIDESLINYYDKDEVDSMVNEKWEMRYTNVPLTGSINTIIENHSMSELIDEWNNGNPPIIYMTDERGDKFYFFPSALFFNDLDVTSYTATYIGNYNVSLVTSCALNEGSDGTIIATLQLHILPTYSDIPSLNGYATEQWVQSQGYLTQHQSLSGYATEQWVEDKGYLTEHQPIKTINNISLIGEGNIEIGTGGTADLSNYYTKSETNDLLDDKLDATAYTPTDLSGYWTSVETQEAINAATSGTPSSATIEGLRNDVNALSGDVYTNYYTKSAVDALIASLQSQIDALSECCSGGGDTGSTEGMKWLLHISGGTEASFPCNDPDDLLPNQIDDGEFTHSHQVFADSDDYSSVTSAYVGDCVYGIMSHAFSGFTNMSAITVPDTLEVIDTHAFYHNYRLATFPYASSLTRIGDFAFSFCHSLTSATIPSGVTSIGQWAFEDCTGLTSVTMEGSTPPTLGNYAFYNEYGTAQLNITIYVPANAVETYKQASGWSDYASRIQAIP